MLSVAHDHELSGHLGICKTYDQLLKHFFWPSMKSDVAKFRKSHNSYLLTLMCASTRFPEAVPLRFIKAQTIVKAVVEFCTMFGMPKHIQSDQGTNFMSNVFAKVMKQLAIKHHVSSAYHPQSQGAIERFHQTLKSMLRTFCVEHEKEWDEHIPLLLFAVRNTTQASLGFSSSELVFGHTVRGPLKIQQEQIHKILSSSRMSPTTSVLDYVSVFHERLHSVWKLAKKSLSSVQSQMKTHYDKKNLSLDNFRLEIKFLF